MPRKTDGDKIDDLTKDVATLSERVHIIRAQVEVVSELSVKVALLEHQVPEIKKSQDKWGQRLWMILAPLVGAAMGSLLTYYLKR